MELLYVVLDIVCCDLCDILVFLLYCDFCYIYFCKVCVGEYLLDVLK